MAKIHTQVIVVGGGMVGLTMGLALTEAGLSVVVIDREDPKVALDQGFDGRASAIARGSKQILDGIGLWPALAAEAAPITDIRVTDGTRAPRGGLGRASALFLHYDCEDVDGAPLGYIVENQNLRRALAEKAARQDHLILLAPAQAARVTRASGKVTVDTDGGQEISASLLVAADGRASPLRGDAGIALDHWDYPQNGIVCTVWHDLPHDNVAHEHFLPAGPFALLPLTDRTLPDGEGAGPGGARHRSSLVWTERRDLVQDMMALDDAAFAQELTRRFGDSLGGLRVAGKRWTYPLALQHAKRYGDQRLALIGDAAHLIHPIAGQGLNLGLRDVAALAESIVDAQRLGLDTGSPQVIARYERWRRFDNVSLIVATDALNRLFSNDLPPLRLARDLGLAMVNQAPPLKRLFMRHAMGLLGDLPRLARGERL